MNAEDAFSPLTRDCCLLFQFSKFSASLTNVTVPRSPFDPDDDNVDVDLMKLSTKPEVRKRAALAQSQSSSIFLKPLLSDASRSTAHEPLKS